MDGVSAPLGLWDPAGLADLGTEKTLAWYRASELKHSTPGRVVSEIAHTQTATHTVGGLMTMRRETLGGNPRAAALFSHVRIARSGGGGGGGDGCEKNLLMGKLCATRRPRGDGRDDGLDH